MTKELKQYIHENLEALELIEEAFIDMLSDNYVEIDDQVYSVKQVNDAIDAYEDETNRDLPVQEWEHFARVSAGEVYD